MSQCRHRVSFVYKCLIFIEYILWLASYRFSFLFKTDENKKKINENLNIPHGMFNIIYVGYEMENHENVFSLNCFGKINKTMFR